MKPPPKPSVAPPGAPTPSKAPPPRATTIAPQRAPTIAPQRAATIAPQRAPTIAPQRAATIAPPSRSLPPKPIAPKPKRTKRDEAEEAREDAFVSQFGEHVRTARLARKLTQAALATRARLSSNYVARLERGEVGPSLWVAHNLAAAMGMKLGDLLTREKLLPPAPLIRKP